LIDDFPLPERHSTLKIEVGYKEYAIIVPESCEVVITRLTIPGESRDTAVADIDEVRSVFIP
jgi:hypothetical protein